VAASVQLAEHDGSVIVPRAALIESPTGQPTVMVVGSDDKVHERTVTVGLSNDRDAEILSGVDPGDRVATVGAYGLPDGAQVTVAAAEGQGAS
jgi:membrane fusion protein (multidrug efflux system)